MAGEAPPRLVQGALAEGEVASLHRDGDARGVVGGREDARVRGGVPGDRGLFRVLHAGRNAVWVTPEVLHTPSPDRVTPPCPVVDRCGGCPWQMVSLPAQRAARRALLLDALGDLPVAEVRPTITFDATVAYRTRALMMARRVKRRLELGFFTPRTDELVAVDACAVQHPTLNAALERARALLDGSGVTTWRSAARAGTLRAIAGRLDPDRDTVLLTLIVSRDDPHLDDLARALVADPRIAGVAACVNPASGGQVSRGAVRHLAGAERLHLRIGGVDAACGPMSFVQTHHAAAGALVRLARELAPPKVGHLVDLYAGIGVFGLALADRAERITLVEESPHAIGDARAALARGSAAAVTLVEGDAAVTAAQVLDGAPGTCVILDPPRAGVAAPVLAAIARAQPDTVIYVSCHPTSFARDARELVAAGYACDVIVPVEMFPHTPHLEVLARFSRPSA